MNAMTDDPAHDILAVDRARLESLAGLGLSDAEIAEVMEIDAAELVETYRSALAQGRIKANARVAENLYRKATGEGREAVTAAIFWLKTRARWKEIHRDDDGNQPVIVQIQRFAEDL